MNTRIGPFFALIALAFASISPSARAQDDFARGEDLFVNNKPAEAVRYLESAIRADPGKEMAYIYLGTAYFQLGKVNDAISTLKRGSASTKAYPHLFSFNLGAIYANQGKNSFAEDLYSEAIQSNPSFEPVYLNRAQVRMELAKYKDAVADYRSYLDLYPETPQRENIERVISLLEQSLAEEDRLKADEARRLAEEAARKAKLLEDVADSLKAAAGDTESLSEGVEGAEGYDAESELAD